MQSNTMHVSGLRELRAKLERIEARVARNVMAGALRSGGRVILRQAKANAKRSGGTGTLARSLVLARDRNARRDRPMYAIYSRRGKSYQMGMRQGRTGSSRKANRNNMDGFYFPWVELGTKARTHKRGPMRWYAGSSEIFASTVRHPGTKPVAMLGRAFSDKQGAAIEEIKRYARQRIEREAERA